MRWGRKVCVCFWATCLFLGGNETGRAADWVVLPSIQTRAAYLNNINYSPTNRQSDYIFSAVPNLDFNYNTEITQIGGSLRLTGLHYLQNSNIDHINQYYNINGNTLATARLSFNLAASYLSTTNLNEAVNSTFIATTRQQTNVINISPGLSYNLTEKWSTNLSYNLTNVDYQSNPFFNYSTNTISSRLNYLYDERTTLITSMTASYSQYQKIDNTIASLGPQIGFTRKFTEKWAMTFLGGANISQVESSARTTSVNNFFGFATVPQAQKQKSSNLSPFINIAANYGWENGGFNFSYTRNQTASAYANQSQYNNFNLGFNQSLTERLNLAISPYFNISTLQGGNSNFSQYYYGTSSTLSYKLTEKTSIGAVYSISYINNTGLQSYSFPVNSVYVYLNYSYPIHFQR